MSLIATAVILLSTTQLAARAGHVLPPLQHTFCMKYPFGCKSQTKAKAQPLPKAQRIREPRQVDRSRDERIDMSLTSTDRKGSAAVDDPSKCGNRFIAGNAATQTDGQEQM